MNWDVKTLGELCDEGGGDIQTGPFGSQLHASDYVDVGVPSVMPQNIGDNVIETDGIARITEVDAARLARYRLRSGDIVYSRRGDVEKRSLVRPAHDGWLCGTGCLRARLGANSRHDARFVSYALGTPHARKWIVRHAVGATMPNLNTSILSALPLRIPSPAEQRGIAEVLGALDDKIAANRNIQDLAPQLCDHMFRELVHGEPASVLVGDLCTVTKGVSYRSSELEDSDTALVTLKCITRDGHFAERGLKPYTGEPKSSQLVTPGEVVVAQTDLTQAADVVGRAVRVSTSAGFARLVASLDLAVVRPRAEVPVEFLLGVLRQPELRRHCRSMTSGTTVLHLAKGAAESYVTRCPSAEQQAAYADRVRPLLERAEAAGAENDKLAATRDALLPLLMSGRVRVKDVEDTAGEVV